LPDDDGKGVMINSRPVTLTAALRSTAMRRVLALSPAIGTREIHDNIAADIRERAFFSARTPYAGYLADTKEMIERHVQPDVRLGPGGLVATRSGESISIPQIRARMKQALVALSYVPAETERGTLTDLSSDRRINLIVDTQCKMARGYGQWKQAQDPDTLDLWPAAELYRALSRETPRAWQDRWNAARSSLGSSTTATLATFSNGPFVALKNDPVWSAISRFGNPYPPFDFNSGMRVRDVSRSRAESLGVIAPDAPPPEPQEQPFAEPEIREIPESVPPDLAAALRRTFSEYTR
jgi:hypothetical protein